MTSSLSRRVPRLNLVHQSENPPISNATAMKRARDDCISVERRGATVLSEFSASTTIRPIITKRYLLGLTVHGLSGQHQPRGQIFAEDSSQRSFVAFRFALELRNQRRVRDPCANRGETRGRDIADRVS